jgi:hypothetical protein
MKDIGGELSQAVSDSTKSPAGVTTNSNYDLFVWDDSGTYRCTRGPAWTSDTGRGTGAGTTELQMISGIYTNAVAISNGPGANRGTYVGTIRTNGSSTVDWSVGGTADGGTAGYIGLWNAYNRVSWTAGVFDSTTSWNYTTATTRASNGSNAMRVSFVAGLAGAHVIETVFNGLQSTATTGGRCGVGYDTTSAFAGAIGSPQIAAGAAGTLIGRDQRIVDLGFHYYQALERGASGTTFYGDNNSPTTIQNGLFCSGEY